MSSAQIPDVNPIIVGNAGKRNIPPSTTDWQEYGCQGQVQATLGETVSTMKVVKNMMVENASNPVIAINAELSDLIYVIHLKRFVLMPEMGCPSGAT